MNIAIEAIFHLNMAEEERMLLMDEKSLGEFFNAQMVSLKVTMAVTTPTPPATMGLSVCEPVLVVEVPECAAPISKARAIQTRLSCF
jgi:hypothetical protein